MLNSESVSILMPCYNAEKHLKDTLKSILNQTYKNFKLIVVNDSSTDSSLQILEHYAQLDDRIELISDNVNRGIIYRRNQLLRLATTQIACWADADDIYLPQRIEKQLKFLLSHTQFSAVSCDYVRMQDGHEQNITVAADRLSLEFMALNNAVFNPGAMFRMSLVNDNNVVFDDRISGASDYQFWCDLARIMPIGQLNEPLVKYRIHSDQESTANRLRQVTGHCEVVARNLEFLGLITSPNEVAKLLIFPCRHLNIKLSKRDHMNALDMISTLIKTNQLDSNRFKTALLTYARAHCMRLGIRSLSFLFKEFGFSWMKNSNYFGLELIHKMTKLKHY